jgi:hypothetical protein
VKTTSPINRSRMRRILGFGIWDLGFGISSLSLNRRLVDKHHGDVVLDGVHPLALIALQGGAIVDQLYRCFAVGTGQYFEEFRVDRHRSSGRLRRESGDSEGL